MAASPSALDLWIRIATLTVAALGFTFTIITLYMNHERARRELAVRLMIDWSNNMDAATKSCMKLVDRLSKNQIKEIWSGEECKLDEKYRPLVIELFREKFDQPSDFEVKDGKITITSLQSEYIEYHWAKYLNRLESTLSAWSCHVAREDMMEVQFGKLLKIYDGRLKNLIENDPDSTNNDPCHPTIKVFLVTIELHDPLPGSGGLLSIFRRSRGAQGRVRS